MNRVGPDIWLFLRPDIQISSIINHPDIRYSISKPDIRPNPTNEVLLPFDLLELSWVSDQIMKTAGYPGQPYLVLGLGRIIFLPDTGYPADL